MMVVYCWTAAVQHWPEIVVNQIYSLQHLMMLPTHAQLPRHNRNSATAYTQNKSTAEDPFVSVFQPLV